VGYTGQGLEVGSEGADIRVWCIIIIICFNILSTCLAFLTVCAMFRML
jgi:hypothetical protein